MRRLYVVVSYVESSDGSFHAKTLEGYSPMLSFAQLYVDTHNGVYDILIYEGDYDSDIYSDIYEDHGYDVGTDVELLIKTWHSQDNTLHIVDTTENVETLLYEISMFDEISLTSITSYLNMSNLFIYMKDNDFKSMMNYLAIKYFHEFIHWMQNCDDYGYNKNYEKYPIDIVKALVINGYLTPIEDIRH